MTGPAAAKAPAAGFLMTVPPRPTAHTVPSAATHTPRSAWVVLEVTGLHEVPS